MSPSQGPIRPTNEEILRLIETRGAVPSVANSGSRPLYGTTIFIAHCELELRYGKFNAFVFQDLITKGYIIALAKGDIQKASVIYTRIHASCIASETLRGCDCDCVKQLEGGLERIASKEAGIFFYLIQEGRGVGYVATARDRMLVQASHERLSTYDAFEIMGLKKDYRNYSSIQAITHLLGVTAPFVVLTNNPDKLSALTELGITIAGHESIEFEAGTFSRAYLNAKARGGHLLQEQKTSPKRIFALPDPVVPFTPHALEEAKRFIYSASYFLPMKPVDGEVVLSKEDFALAKREISIEQFMKTERGFISRMIRHTTPIIQKIEEISGERVLISIDRKMLGAFRKENPNHKIIQLLTLPYWFKVHVYYDLVSSQDFIVLQHGSEEMHGTPIVRLQSESIFDRFPLLDVSNRDKLKASAKLIVRHGHGIIALLYNDGRGAGFGAHATDKMFRERTPSLSGDETYKSLGIEYDLRDYNAAMRLIRHHVPKGEVQMVMNSPESLVRKHEHAEAVSSAGLSVTKWHFLEEK